MLYFSTLVYNIHIGAVKFKKVWTLGIQLLAHVEQIFLETKIHLTLNVKQININQIHLNLEKKKKNTLQIVIGET